MTLTDDVYEKLRQQILTVERAPGDLLYEAELASLFQVSKTPVREALRLLAQTGWVVVLPHKGYIVRPVRLNDIRDIFAIRRMIEPALAAEACEISSASGHLDKLEGILEQQSAAGDDIAQALTAARSFHLTLAGIAGSSRALRILEDLVDEVIRLHHLLPGIEGHIISADEIEAHRRLVEALKAKDAPTTRALMEEHLNEVAHTLVRGFSGM
ncbi:GntR family transcriptional regulator [Streptomyces chartreusis]|uniref:GntR family transcriptional regulator n=1 Tax=Streptomyces chartreusis TaxID=1969 RepID=A0A7H8T1D1_STRCX|nr:GntR family transcriptional regulator [Streptomyces chartreusis]QKZ17293.1 GntR family transcriptional regulator [Streptomyces chartreusis]